VLRASAGPHVAVLPSLWENLPHAAVEALAVGTPVVATAVGGVPEVVHDDENGLLVPAGDVSALAAALRRMLDDDALRDRLAAGAKPSVAAIGREPVYTRLEQILEEAAL
jgi:glycosyltransferase involved in cell wall biosynthesis